MGMALNNLNEIKQFNSHLPDWVYHRNLKNIAPISSPKEVAIQDKYIAPFHHQFPFYFAVDIDHEHWEDYVSDLGLNPNIVIQNKDNNKCHLLYKTVGYWLGKGSSSKLRDFHKAIGKQLSVELGGDGSFNNQTIKNPNHPDWNVYELHDEALELWQFNQKMILPKRFLSRGEKNINKHFDIGTGQIQRNETVFHSIRHFAYYQKNQHSNSKSFDFEVGQFAHEVNNMFPHKLGIGEMNQIIESVCTWVWNADNDKNKYRGRKDKRGRDYKALLFNEIYDTKEQQRFSASHTNWVRTEKNLNLVKGAIEIIELRGDKATQINIVRETKLTRKTVRKYIDMIKEEAYRKREKEKRKKDYATKKRKEWIDDKVIQALLDAPNP